MSEKKIEEKKRAHRPTGKPHGRPPTKVPKVEKPKEEKQLSPQAQTLELDKPAEKKPQKAKEGSTTYSCASCKAKLSVGQKFCGSCGTHLDWAPLGAV